MGDVFGTILTGAAVEQAAVDTLAAWHGTYLAELERRSSGRWAPGDLPRVRRWLAAADMEKFPEHGLPTGIVINSTATAGARAGDGRWSGDWPLEVAIIVQAHTPRALAMAYAAAARVALLQHPDLGGLASGCRWLGDEYGAIPFDDTRSLDAGVTRLTVTVDDVMTDTLTPLQPSDPDAPPDYPTIETVTVEETLTEDTPT